MVPFMSCSARLPVYTLLIGAMFVANRPVLGPFTEGGLILLSMYLLGTLSALLLGAIYKRTMLKGPVPPLVLELPPYRLPRLRDTLRQVGDRTADFLKDAGTIILAVTIVLWGLLSFPRVDEADLAPGETAIERSYAGQFGKAIEPALEPIGQDWRIGIGLIGSFAAREVLVSTLGLVYGIENADEDDAPLREVIRDSKDEAGNPRYSKVSALALMVFFRLRVPVHVDARGRATGDSQLEMAGVHAREHDGDRLFRGAVGVPGGAGAGALIKTPARPRRRRCSGSSTPPEPARAHHLEPRCRASPV